MRLLIQGIVLAVAGCCCVQFALRNEKQQKVSPSPSFEGLGYRELLLQYEGEVDWPGVQELRRQMLEDIKSGNLSAFQMDSNQNSQTWREMGPSETAGRTRAIAQVSGDTLLAGGVSGGLWRSSNRGNDWERVAALPALMIGSVAVASNGDIYVGTGSNFDGAGGEGGSGFRGNGIWWSTDNGVSFALVEGTSGYDATDGIVADPLHSNRVWYASMDGYGSITDGVLLEVPGSANSPTNATDLAIAPDGSYCLVSAANGRVYRSIGGDFTDLQNITQGSGQNGYLPQSGIGRSRVCIATTPNEEGTYNAFAAYATSGGWFYGLFFSDDEGLVGSWSKVWPGEIQGLTPLPRAQGIYDLALGISPEDPTLAYVGGIELWRCGPDQQAEGAALPFDAPGYAYAMHPDIHEVLTASDGTMYFATDGGIYRSEDSGLTFQEVNSGFNVSQHYGLAFGPHGEILSGTQDNGNLILTPSRSHAQSLSGDDGFDSALSQRVSNSDSTLAWIATSSNGEMTRGTWSNGEVTNYGGFYDANFNDLYSSGGDLGQFYTCMRHYEDDEDASMNMTVIGLNGGLGVWMTRGAFDFSTSPSWVRIADAPSGFSGTKAIEFVEHGAEAGNVLYLTGWNGTVTRVTGLLNVFSQADVEQLQTVTLLGSAGAAVTGLSVDPADANHVVVSVGGYGNSSAGKVRETFNAMSENVMWSNIWSSSGYNNLPCYDVLIDVLDPSGQTIWVGTEFGVFVTENGGNQWDICNSGMASSASALGPPIFDIKQQTRQGGEWPDVLNFGEIYLATHGQGVFTTQETEGCTDELACNYWRGAVMDNGTCEYESCAGCNDPSACNYNNNATQLVDCNYDCYGCIDPTSVNFDAEASYDDGSCVSNFATCDELLEDDWSGLELAWWPGDTLTVTQDLPFSIPTAFSVPTEIQDGPSTYSVIMFAVGEVEGLPAGVTLETADVDASNTGCWLLEGIVDSAAIYEVVVQGDLFVEFFFNSIPIPFSFTTSLDVMPTVLSSGCTYPAAVNYEPSALQDDGSCVFAGCTDSLALNYAEVFLEDDGTCLFLGVNPSCPEDLNVDGQVNTMDLLSFLSSYGLLCAD